MLQGGDGLDMSGYSPGINKALPAFVSHCVSAKRFCPALTFLTKSGPVMGEYRSRDTSLRLLEFTVESV